MRHLSKFFYLTTTALVLIFCLDLQAQKSKTQLQKEKSSIQNQIKEAQEILAQTSSKKKASIGQLNAINKQIDGHSKMIRAYTRELKTINGQIEEDEIVLNALEADLENLKEEYSATLYSMQKSSSGFSRLSFIFASADLNQFYMRFKYLEHYAEARKNQVKSIVEIRSDIEEEKSSLMTARSEKNALLTEQLDEKKKLDKLKVDQNRIFANLKNEENQLRRDIAEKKDDVTKLERLISKLLEEEIASAARAENKAKVKAEIGNLSTSFEKSKAQLIWPVNTGFISEKFGTHPHPVLKRVQMPNDGVNIQTKENEKVKAVFNGVVKKIAIVPGEFKYVVIVQHGSYYTVYAKLRVVNVKMGQQVARNDVIGEVNTDSDGISEVQFQVWKNTQKLDPELWLAKR